MNVGPSLRNIMGETVPPGICLNDYGLPRVVHVIGFGLDKI